MNFATNTASDILFTPRTAKKSQVFGRGTRVRFTCRGRFRVPEGDEDLTPSVVEQGATGTVLSVFPMFVIKLDTERGYQELKWHPGLEVQRDLEIIKKKPALRVVK